MCMYEWLLSNVLGARFVFDWERPVVAALTRPQGGVNRDDDRGVAAGGTAAVPNSVT